MRTLRMRWRCTSWCQRSSRQKSSPQGAQRNTGKHRGNLLMRFAGLPCRRCLAHRLQPFESLLRPAQGFLDVVANVLGTDQLLKLRLLDQLQGLLPGAAKNQLATARL